MAEQHNERPERPVEFRTVLFLYILLGAAVALLIHFILLSTPTFNWLAGA
ncbi:MAG: light-harvesting protein [Ardenticatenaceae bacterium]|nr:light-harvesting protein [Ardenticatenaceae bacterium]